jgi:hypothetical protein
MMSVAVGGAGWVATAVFVGRIGVSVGLTGVFMDVAPVVGTTSVKVLISVGLGSLVRGAALAKSVAV